MPTWNTFNPRPISNHVVRQVFATATATTTTQSRPAAIADGPPPCFPTPQQTPAMDCQVLRSQNPLDTSFSHTFPTTMTKPPSFELPRSPSPPSTPIQTFS